MVKDFDLWIDDFVLGYERYLWTIEIEEDNIEDFNLEDYIEDVQKSLYINEGTYYLKYHDKKENNEILHSFNYFKGMFDIKYDAYTGERIEDTTNGK